MSPAEETGAVEAPLIEAHLIIRGRVQGVGYRFSLQQQALTHRVRGWVHNRPDGSVESVLQGPRGALDAIIDWCWRGPRGAAVHDVEVTWGEPSQPISDFEIRE